MIRDVDTVWINKLAKTAKTEELPPKIAELAKVIGVEAAIKAYVYYSPLQTSFPEYEVNALKKLYVKKEFGLSSATEIARRIGTTATFVYKVINAVPGANPAQISMFDID